MGLLTTSIQISGDTTIDVPPIITSINMSIDQFSSSEYDIAIPTIRATVDYIGYTYYYAESSADISLSTSLSSEKSVRASADTSLSTAISSVGGGSTTSLSTAISSEISTRGTADTSLSTAISTANSTRSTADTSLSTAVSTSNSTRSSADTSLSTAISTSNSTRGTADTSLSTAITNVINGTSTSNFIFGQNGSGTNTQATTQDLTHVWQWKSGFWEASGTAWTPNTGWFWGLTMAHSSNTSSYNYCTQIASDYTAHGNLYTRNISGGASPVASAWAKIWTENNDGSGSGLDADLLDGLNSSSYVQTTGNQSISGAKTFNDIIYSALANESLRFGYGVSSATPYISFYDNTARQGFIQYTGGSCYIGASEQTNLSYIVLQYGINGLSYQTSSTSYTVWHSGNDGTGTGLDADLWDGNQFATYLNQAVLTSSSPSFVRLTSTQATGTAPFTVASTTVVSNLNADLWDGNQFSSYLNQAVLSSSSPTFASVTSSGVFLGSNGTVANPTYSFTSYPGYGLFTTATYMGLSFGSSADYFRFTNGGVFHAESDIIAYSSTVPSDIRLKENVKNIDNGLSIIDQLNPVSFTWKDPKKASIGVVYGLIAQDVEKILPEIVKEHNMLGKPDDEMYKSVNYEQIIPFLIKSIKELKEEINILKNK